MAELIALIILAISFIGIAIILLRKIPVLAKLPEPASKPFGENFKAWLKNKIADSSFLKSPSLEIFLQKVISKIRILSLRIENKTFNWLQKLREMVKKKNLLNDDYWQGLKSQVNKKIKRKKQEDNNLPM